MSSTSCNSQVLLCIQPSLSTGDKARLKKFFKRQPFPSHGFAGDEYTAQQAVSRVSTGSHSPTAQARRSHETFCAGKDTQHNCSTAFRTLKAEAGTRRALLQALYHCKHTVHACWCMPTHITHVFALGRESAWDSSCCPHGAIFRPHGRPAKNVPSSRPPREKRARKPPEVVPR